MLAAPTARDAEITQTILARAKIACVACPNLSRLSREIEAGAGAILLTEEALGAAGTDELLATLRKQPAWSELPLVILMRGSDRLPTSARVLDSLTNVTLLERPAPIRSVVSAVQTALRGRERQYQIRDQIHAIHDAEQRARQLQQQLELAVDASQLGTFYCPMPLGKIVWNERCKVHFWLPPDAEVDFDLFYSLLHPDDRERARQAVAACVYGGEIYDIEYRTVSARGDVRWVHATGRTYRNANDEPIRFDGTTQDVTERKHLEETLKLANRRKDEFLALLAHELRNPLAPIRNGVEIMRLLGPGNPQIIRDTGELIARQVTHLARLVDDLLDVSRVTQGKVLIKEEPVELASAINNGIELAQPLIDAKRHKLSISLPTTEALRVRGDPTRLAQIVGNLLDNAAKYTNADGRISLSVVREGDEAVITVEDNGVGISRGLLPHVFELFTQGERSVDRAQGGLGIGLSLVKSLVELHRGAVAAASAGYGTGSTFTVRLPVLMPPHAPASPAQGALPTNQSSARRRILVVDDNEDAALSMGLLLEQDGHEVQYAYEGRSALDVAQVFEPEVALLDIGLPGLNGFEVAQQLRARPQTAGALLVALTGYGQSEDRQRTQAAGFDHHLVKPVEPQMLLALIARYTVAGKQTAEKEMP